MEQGIGPVQVILHILNVLWDPEHQESNKSYPNINPKERPNWLKLFSQTRFCCIPNPGLQSGTCFTDLVLAPLVKSKSCTPGLLDHEERAFRGNWLIAGFTVSNI